MNRRREHISKGVPYFTGSPYLFPDAVHDLDLLDRSVAATLLVNYVEWSRYDLWTNENDPLRIGEVALNERASIWEEYWVRGDFVDLMIETSGHEKL